MHFIISSDRRTIDDLEQSKIIKARTYGKRT